jgi:hypothetical protein
MSMLPSPTNLSHHERAVLARAAAQVESVIGYQRIAGFLNAMGDFETSIGAWRVVILAPASLQCARIYRGADLPMLHVLLDCDEVFYRDAKQNRIVTVAGKLREIALGIVNDAQRLRRCGMMGTSFHTFFRDNGLPVTVEYATGHICDGGGSGPEIFIVKAWPETPWHNRLASIDAWLFTRPNITLTGAWIARQIAAPVRGLMAFDEWLRASLTDTERERMEGWLIEHFEPDLYEPDDYL